MTYPKYIDTIFHNIGRDYLDHFEKRKDENGKTIYISQPYFIGNTKLRTSPKPLKKKIRIPIMG
jgi:hypothetical protein